MFDLNNITNSFFYIADEFIRGLKYGFSYYSVLFIVKSVLKSHIRLEILIYVITIGFIYNKMKNNHNSLIFEIKTNKLKTEELIEHVINLEESLRQITNKNKEKKCETKTTDCEHKWHKQCFGYDDYWRVCQLCGLEEC